MGQTFSELASNDPVSKPVLRSGNEVNYLVEEGGIVRSIGIEECHAKLSVDGIIRIIDTEYTTIDRTLSFFTHFNLEFTDHQVGLRYALARVLKQGHYNGPSDEELPVISFFNIAQGECTWINPHTEYGQLQESDFAYSMRSIRTVSELEAAILRRYRVSMPALSDADILALGVGLTTLRFD